MKGIYLITNTINGKQYIGKSVKLETRWSTHKSDAKFNRYPNVAIHKAINKYGEDNFTFEVIATADDESLLDDLEQKCILEYNCYGNNGYNMTMGGDGGYSLSEESKRKIGEKNRQNWANGVYDGTNVGMKGKNHTDEAKKKMRENCTCQVTVHYTDGSIKDFGKILYKDLSAELGISEDLLNEFAKGKGYRKPRKGVSHIELIGGQESTRTLYKNARTLTVYLCNGTTETFQGHRKFKKKYGACKVGYIPRKWEGIVDRVEVA